MAGENKFLINCSFDHYPGGTREKVKNFALIIKESDIENGDLKRAIWDKLTELNFQITNWYDLFNVTFTSQLFN